MSDIRKKSDKAMRRRAATAPASGPTPAVPDYGLAPTVRADSPTQLKALGDPIRTAILHLVLERAATTSELAEALGRPKGTVDHHLKVLEAAGLLRVVRTRKVRALTERFWGRTGRTILIADSNGDSGTSLFLTEAMEHFRRGEHNYISLRYARIPPERVDEFGRRLDALAGEFAASPRDGNVVHGLLLALAATDQPILADRGAGDD
jgi:DNA-binding transcriptional ArsR family regulator